MLNVFCSLFLLAAFPYPVFAETPLAQALQNTLPAIVEVQTVYTKRVRSHAGRPAVTFERRGLGVILDA